MSSLFCCVWTAYELIGCSKKHDDIFNSLPVWSLKTGVRCNEVSWDTVSDEPIKARRRQPSSAMAPACNCHHHTTLWDLKGCCSAITKMQFGILSKDMKYNSRGGRAGGNATRQPKDLCSTQKDTVPTIILIVTIHLKFRQTLLVRGRSAAHSFAHAHASTHRHSQI